MSEELKPCPFCGGEAEFHTDKGFTGELYGWVGCGQCDATSCQIDVRSMQPEETHPIAAWNTRHTIETQAAEIEELRAQLKTVLDREAETHRRHDAKVEAQAAEIKRLRELLARHVDGEQPCWRDHHGYCQAHYLEEDCRVAAARAALGETE